MNKAIIRLAMTAAVIVPLSACSKNDRATDPVVVAPPPTPPPPTGVAFTVESFGGGFASAFRANENGEPRDPGEGDIIPISFTTDSSDPIGF